VRSLRLSILAATLSYVASAATLRADEEKVPLDKLPAAVADAVKKRFPKADLIKATKETEDGKTEYEVSISDAGAKMDVTVDPAGIISAIEKSIAVTDLPKAVRSALDGKYASATYRKAEQIIKLQRGKETLECYEVIVEKADKSKVAVQVEADGKIKKEEKQ
jgi:hypothetical protein